MDDDDPIGGGTLVMTPQAPSSQNPEQPGSGPGPGHPRLVPAPIALPGELDRRLPRPPIFQVQAFKDAEATSVDEPPTRQKQDSSSGARNLHPAFAQTELQPFGPPLAGSQGPFSPAPPKPWPDQEAAGYPAPPVSPHGPPRPAPGATTLQGVGALEQAARQGDYSRAPLDPGEPGFIPPRVMDEMSHTTADMSGRKLVLTPIAIGAAAGLLVTVVVVGVILLVREPSAPEVAVSASAAAATTPVDAAEPSTAPTATATPSAVASASAAPLAAPTDADAKAQAALEKLKEGIEYCVKSTIHVLPGASPAVPSSIAWLKSGPYESLKRDWASPFFSCTRFKVEEPMPFMIQWQIDEPNAKGTAVVWLDPNGDGVVDRAYGFKATLVKRDKVEFGPVESIDASRKVQRAR